MQGLSQIKMSKQSYSCTSNSKLGTEFWDKELIGMEAGFSGKSELLT